MGKILLFVSFIAFLGIAMAPAGEAWHGTESYHYRSPGPLESYEPVQGHCTVDVIPPDVDCAPAVDTRPLDTLAGTATTLRWYYYHYVSTDRLVTIQFYDAVHDDVMFKVDGQLCVTECGVLLQNHDGAFTISIDPLDFTGAELASHALPASGYFEIRWP